MNWGLDSADQFLQSWAYWGDVIGNNKTIRRISRIYARAIAGKVLAMQYIANLRTFYLSYDVDPNITQPTEIFIPAIQFPQQSYNVTVNAALKWRVDPTNPNVILVEPSEQAVTSKEQAVIGVVDIRPTM